MAAPELILAVGPAVGMDRQVHHNRWSPKALAARRQESNRGYSNCGRGFAGREA